MGNRLSVTASMPGAPATYSGTTSYAYDYGQSANPLLNRSQLTGETSTRATRTQSYAYDGGTAGGPGNPTSFKGVANTFNSDNQATGSGYGYNGNGNPVYYPGHNLSFDPENRLSGINVGLGTSYAYDGDGLQVVKTVAYFVAGHPGGVGPHTAYTYSYKLYDGTQPVCEYGTSVATTTFGADGLVSRYGSGNTTFFTFDERGNMAQCLDKTAAVVSSDQYDAYGKQTSTAGGDNYGFGAQVGYYTDSSGLILCTHRYYDPVAGRWLTRYLCLGTYHAIWPPQTLRCRHTAKPAGRRSRDYRRLCFRVVAVYRVRPSLPCSPFFTLFVPNSHRNPDLERGWGFFCLRRVY